MQDMMESWTTRRAAASGERGVVAAQHWRAAEIGAAALREGGSAADAAVACALALAACEPWMSGLGGSGLAVVWEASAARAAALDFHGVLPKAARSDDYPLDAEQPETLMGFPGVVERRNIVGGKAITVPGALRGLAELHRRHGRLGFDRLVAPAVDLARGGLRLEWHGTLMIAVEAGDLRANRAAAEQYLRDGAPPEPPATMPMPRLAETLAVIGEEGPDALYRGPLAERVADDLAAAGSRIAAEDLADYRARWLEVEPIPFRDVLLHTAGESSGGLRLARFAEMLGNPLDGSAESWARVEAALLAAWREHLLRAGQAEAGCTTHLSVCDGEGNLVALTSTLLNRFGSRVVLPSSGITMNNAASYFDPRPGRPMSIAPGRRVAASNMCPVVASRDGEGWFALGAAGASRIVPAVAQAAAGLVDRGLDLEDALGGPRIDVEPDGTTLVDPRLGDEVLAKMRPPARFAQCGVFPKHYGCPQGVLRKGGVAFGMADPSHPCAWACAA